METTGNRRRGTALAAVLFLALGAVLATGCRDKAGTGTVPGARPPVTGVEVVTVSTSTEEKMAEAVGTVRARNIALVAPQAMGRVTSLPVSEGSVVEKGALLFTIDDAAIRAQAASAEGTVAEAEAAKDEAGRAVSQAEAGKTLAEKTYGRFSRLYEDKVATRQEFEEVEARKTVAVKEYERALERRAQAAARILQARGQADAALAALSYTRVAAPFSGVVTEKRAEVGSMAVPGVPLLVLEDTRRYRLEAPVPETWISRIEVGARVQVVLEAGNPLPAVVSEIVPMVAPDSRTFLVKADIVGAGLRTGMYGRLRFPAGKGTVLAVPRSAISRAGGYDGVFVVTPDNVARLTMVKTGGGIGDRVEILSGIEPGSRVAVSHLDKLADGIRVEARK
jgi:RND family efflux transporter MFP subunit